MDRSEYKLYYNEFSICSIMVRYTWALRDHHLEGGANVSLNGIAVDLVRGEQLAEHFLCDVNPKGQVSNVVPSWPFFP